MATKKQKRLAGEARAAERDAAHQAEIERRKRIADKRAERRLKRETAEQRRAQNIKATKMMRGGSRPFVEEQGDVDAERRADRAANNWDGEAYGR